MCANVAALRITSMCPGGHLTCEGSIFKISFGVDTQTRLCIGSIDTLRIDTRNSCCRFLLSFTFEKNMLVF